MKKRVLAVVMCALMAGTAFTGFKDAGDDKGNLRSGTDALSVFVRTGNKTSLKKAGYYFGIILFFAIGAGIGGNLSMLFGIHTIWISSALLSISVLLMFAEKLKI